VSYQDFLRTKALVAPVAGFKLRRTIESPHLFPFQADLTTWALRRGRAALFADTGLGKSRMQLMWAAQVAKRTKGRIIIFAPLAVSEQTVEEGAAIGVPVVYARSLAESDAPILITNYEMRDHFDPAAFVGVVLDESSILKSSDGETRTAMIDSFAATPYRLACTATPSPNDFTELGNHAEFLGVMRRTEMLAMFFAHDGGSTQDWYIKGHAREAFWRWVCSWAALVKRPSDIGYDDIGYDLPPLVMHEHRVAATAEQARAHGLLFAAPAITLGEQRDARRASMKDRVRLAADVVASEPTESWMVWCELNAESEALTAAIHGAVEITGAMTPTEKRARMVDWLHGRSRVIVTKPSVAGFGVNAQHCARSLFVGVSHSFEQWYQAVRRNWRFGQTREVHSHIIVAELEGAVLANLRRKEADATKLADEMRRYTAATVRHNVRGAERETDAYEPTVTMTVPQWVRTGPEAP
jgi:hypothetical protein